MDAMVQFYNFMVDRKTDIEKCEKFIISSNALRMCGSQYLKMCERHL